MALSALDDPKVPPTDATLAKVLGRSMSAWKRLRASVIRDCSPVEEQWAFAGAKFGWSLRLKRGQRILVHMTPGEGHFLASFALGEKACAAAQAARLPASILAVIAEAPKYAEGCGVRIPVRTTKDVAAIRALVAIKLEN